MQTPSEQIENNFRSHSCDENQNLRMTTVRKRMEFIADVVNGLCPNSREKSLALTKLEEAMFWANAAISRNPPL